MKERNVILITSDSLRADYLSCLGHPRETTPNIDELARNGVLFTQAMACGPNTATSISPLLLSSYVVAYYLDGFGELKTVGAGLSRYRDMVARLNRIKTPIAGILKNNGYNTAAFHSNPYLSRYYNHGKGFHHFDDSFSMGNIKRSKIKEKLRATLRGNERLYSLTKRIYYGIFKMPYDRAETINKKAISWLKDKENEQRNFFIWFHYMDTHIPYFPPSKFCERKLFSTSKMRNIYHKMMSGGNISQKELSDAIRFYEGAIKYVDYSIRSLLDELDAIGVLENTMVIITADHGEELGEHGVFLHPLEMLYDAQLHVPLIIYNAGYTGVTIDMPVNLIDIAPTITDISGLPAAESFQGRSLVPVIKGERSITGVISESLDPQRCTSIASYRTEQWKYIFNGTNSHHELYDIKNDPGETENLYENARGKAEEYESKITAHISKQKEILTVSNEKERMKKSIRKLRKSGKL